MLIDSHAHIQGKEYAGEAEAVIERARAAGVEKIIAVGGAGDMSSNTEAVALADSFPNIYATVGMHPHDAKDVGADELRALRELTSHAKVIAVGETGLDYYYNHSPHEVQRRVFTQFIHMFRDYKWRGATRYEQGGEDQHSIDRARQRVHCHLYLGAAP